MTGTLQTDPANYVWEDIFPATIESEAFQPTHEEYRVIITDSHFYIMDDTINGPDFIFRSPLQDLSGHRKSGLTVVTDAGTFIVRRATNCGCGSRLRGIYPFSGGPFQGPTTR